MTAVRAARLEVLGFAWVMSSEQNLISKLKQAASTNETAWEAQLARLAAYKEAHGDCGVPQGWAEDPRLGKWVNNQRAYKRKLDRGEYSDGMTAARAARLTALGFVWNPSGHDPRRVHEQTAKAVCVGLSAAWSLRITVHVHLPLHSKVAEG
jgi:hypothetical protein